MYGPDAHPLTVLAYPRTAARAGRHERAPMRQPGDFVSLGLHIDLAQDHVVRVIERGEQVPAGFCAAG